MFSRPCFQDRADRRRGQVFHASEYRNTVHLPKSRADVNPPRVFLKTVCSSGGARAGGVFVGTESCVFKLLSVGVNFDHAESDALRNNFESHFVRKLNCFVRSEGGTYVNIADGQPEKRIAHKPADGKRRQPRAETRSAMRISDSGKLTEAGRVRTPSAFGLRVDLLSVMIKPSLF